MSQLRFIAALIFVCTLALYIRTTAPTLGGGWDSEEFQHVAYSLGIAHSTGYPLYLILGKIFTTLVPLGNIAYRMNLLSAVIGAFTAVVVYLNAFTLTRRHIASIAIAALFATNPAVWRQAGVASVGPLNLLLFASIIYALLLWRDKRAPLTIAAFIFGLGLAHHRTTLFLLPAILLFILLIEPGIVRRPRELARNLFFLGLPLAFYLYLPIFGANSPWYVNTPAAFFNYIVGSEAGNYTRATSIELVQAFVQLLLYLHESFGYLGLVVILFGALSVLPQWRTSFDSRVALLLGLGVLTYLGFATFVSGEPDRYLVLPFVFLLYWFAIGISTIENVLDRKSKIENRKFPSSFILHPSSLQIVLALILTLFLALPFPDRFRLADWSAFDRVYKQWDEIFSLPIPANATIVGNWGQLNAMRYMQRIENRRPDLQFVGTLYDPAPQTNAAHETFAQGRTIFISPGLPQPLGEYRYAQLGPLLEVRDKPQMQTPATAIAKNISISPALTLANFEITTALESYAPLTSIAPNRTARVTLDWHAESSVKDFLVRIKLYDPENRLIAQKDEPPVRGLYPAAQWSRGEYVRDVHNVLIPAGSPPGNYSLKVQAIDATTKQPTGNEIALASFAVERATNLTREQVFIARPLDLALNDRIALVGYGGFENERRAGENLSGNLIFFARENIGTDLTLQFALTDSAGKTIASWQRAPIDFYPTREWQRSEILKAYYDLLLPQNLPSGEYSFTVGSQTTFTINKIQIAP